MLNRKGSSVYGIKLLHGFELTDNFTVEDSRARCPVSARECVYCMCGRECHIWSSNCQHGEGTNLYTYRTTVANVRRPHARRWPVWNDYIFLAKGFAFRYTVAPVIRDHMLLKVAKVSILWKNFRNMWFWQYLPLLCLVMVSWFSLYGMHIQSDIEEDSTQSAR